MTTLISPGVAVREIDLTTIVPSVSTTEGAIAGPFRWGPIGERVLVDSETTLVQRFAKPTNYNAETFFTAASFLGYGNRLYVSRAANTAGISPSANVTVSAGNNTIVLGSGNTASLESGLTVIGTANNGLAIGSTIQSIINSIAFSITASSGALANTVDTIQFLSNTAFNALANTAAVANVADQIVKNETDFARNRVFDSDVPFVARFPGAIGNSLRVSVCGNSSGYASTLSLNAYGTSATLAVNVNSNTATVIINAANGTVANTAANSLKSSLNVTDNLAVGNSSIGTQYMRIAALSNNVTNATSTTFNISFEDQLKLSSDFTYDSASGTANTISRYWEFFNLVDSAPAQSEYQINFGNSAINSDQLHVVVVDDGGKFTGVPGTVLETFKAVSRATDAKTIDGAANFYKTVINDSSLYVYATNDISGAPSANAENLVDSTLGISTLPFNLGNDGKDEVNLELASILSAYDLFKSKEDVDVSLILQGRARSFQLANYLIDNIAEPRMDCIVMVSPQKGDVVNNVGNEAQSIVNFRSNVRSSSYGVMDSGYKYMYDRYNDVYRWIPLNGDTGGLCVRTDTTNDAWWSPAGYNRGQIKNVIKLAFNPGQSDRDTLYKAGVNPVVTFPGQGTVLFGDKTLLSKPSAFDRINVRRLFIVLEKAIAKAAQYTLFEFNDAFTRSQFKNLVVPYLREVQGRRGITDFLVVCDDTNNTAEVIDSNQFVGDIYIKPARSINFITLNFVAVRTGISFNEIVGKF